MLLKSATTTTLQKKCSQDNTEYLGSYIDPDEERTRDSEMTMKTGMQAVTLFCTNVLSNGVLLTEKALLLVIHS